MPRFSTASELQLSTCHPALRDLFETVVEEYDCVCLEGHRDQAAQHAAFVSGHSKLDWPRGKHNALPSLAVDVAPAPLDWGDSGSAEQRDVARIRFYHFAGYVLGVARGKGIKIRYGGDWNGNHLFADERFLDLVHFELVDPSPAPPPRVFA